MYIVKLTFNYDWPILRQSKNRLGIWGNYKFVIDENLKECDFWVIYSDYRLVPETVKCNKRNIIFIPAECYSSGPKYSSRFLNQFGTVITVQREIRHRNIIYSHNANPWFINKTLDQLISEKSPEKTKLISIISSNKTFLPGHKKRLDFVKKLKAHFGDRLDVFGRGIRDFDDKWEVVAPYKYSIAIENDFCDDWVTEKFFDCLYADAYTFYYGCPNLEKYVDGSVFCRIDINNPEDAIRKISALIYQENHYELVRENIAAEKRRSLQEDHFFPWIVEHLNSMDPTLKKKWNQVSIHQTMKSNLISRGLLKLKIKFSRLPEVLSKRFQ